MRRDKRSRVLTEEVLGPGREEGSTEFLVTTVSYNSGGANYFSGGTETRGYYVSIGPETRKGGMVSFMLFSGGKALLAPAARYSDKALAALVPDPAIVARLRATVLERRRAELEKAALRIAL